ncbi:MAG: nitroreductase family protein [Clostridia bacterium]|nr:nitroreductase family protein [Clostridia bacterium]
MDYFELIEKRESCRKFDGRAVEQDKLMRCIEAARIAPSACNGQPWSFILVTEDALVNAVRDAVQGQGMNKFCDNCNSFIVVIEEDTVLTSRIGAMIKHTDFKPIDIGIATAHLVLAATAQGVATCILGWFAEKKLKEAFHIKSSKRVKLVIALGYAASDTLREKRRKKLEDICIIKS